MRRLALICWFLAASSAVSSNVGGQQHTADELSGSQAGVILQMPDGQLRFELFSDVSKSERPAREQASFAPEEQAVLEAGSRGGLGDFGSFKNTPFDTNTWKKTVEDIDVSEKLRQGITEYRTNKFDLKAGIERGGWAVAWGEDISETDLINGVVAVGVSINSGNPAAFKLWVDQLVWRTIDSLRASAAENFPRAVAAQAQQFAAQVLFNALRGRKPIESIKNFDTLDFKAGMIQYRGGNYVAGQLITPTGGFKPYVAFRWRGSRRPGNVISPSHASQASPYRVDIENPNNYTVYYTLNGKKHALPARVNRWHTRNTPVFNVSFDSSFAPGDQATNYKLRPGSRNVFVQQGNRLDLKIRR